MPTVIVVGDPPNLGRIKAAGLDPPRTAIFAYDGTIFSPAGLKLPGHVIHHEEVHFRQQEAYGGADAWWDRYLTDIGFRLEQEVEAYREQIRFFRSRVKDIKKVIALMGLLARDLSGPMYGNLVTFNEAVDLLNLN